MKVLNYVTKENFAAILDNIKKQDSAFEAPAGQAYLIAIMPEDAHSFQKLINIIQRRQQQTLLML
jgi:hypothetical protein